MIFSYYFNITKTHLVNCGFDVKSITINSQQTVETNFIAYIEEVIDGEVKKRESTNRVFQFPIQAYNESNHDVDFLRKRFADEKKWIFEIRNNKDSSQNISIGLISDTAITNPIGLDILHDNKLFNSEVRASNLSRIDDQTSAPVIKQTMAESNFTANGYPRGFSSTTSKHNNELGYMAVKDFIQKTYEAIPHETQFTIEMNIAPESFDLKYPGDALFSFSIENIGEFKAYKDHISFLKANQPVEQSIEVYFDNEKALADFYNNGFQSDSKLIMEADGRNYLSVRYAGKKITTAYNSNVIVSQVEMAGGISTKAIEEVEEKDPNNFISSKIDNLIIFYNK